MAAMAGPTTKGFLFVTSLTMPQEVTTWGDFSYRARDHRVSLYHCLEQAKQAEVEHSVYELYNRMFFHLTQAASKYVTDRFFGVAPQDAVVSSIVLTTSETQDDGTYIADDPGADNEDEGHWVDPNQMDGDDSMSVDHEEDVSMHEATSGPDGHAHFGSDDSGSSDTSFSLGEGSSGSDIVQKQTWRYVDFMITAHRIYNRHSQMLRLLAAEVKPFKWDAATILQPEIVIGETEFKDALPQLIQKVQLIFHQHPKLQKVWGMIIVGSSCRFYEFGAQTTPKLDRKSIPSGGYRPLSGKEDTILEVPTRMSKLFEIFKDVEGERIVGEVDYSDDFKVEWSKFLEWAENVAFF